MECYFHTYHTSYWLFKADTTRAVRWMYLFLWCAEQHRVKSFRTLLIICPHHCYIVGICYNKHIWSHCCKKRHPDLILLCECASPIIDSQSQMGLSALERQWCDILLITRNTSSLTLLIDHSRGYPSWGVQVITVITTWPVSLTK